MGNIHKLFVALGLIVVLVTGAVGSIAAHETQNVDGYEMTFGGADEPLITGERTWLELEITNNETGEPVANQSETLNIAVQKPGYERMNLTVSERFGESGVYEAPVIFTEPGEYVVHVRGSFEDTDVHTHFEVVVDDHSELRYPTNETRENVTQMNQTG